MGRQSQICTPILATWPHRSLACSGRRSGRGTALRRSIERSGENTSRRRKGPCNGRSSTIQPRHGHCGSSALSQFKLLYKFSLISWTSVPFRRKKKEARRKWVGHFSTCQPVYRAIHPLCRNVYGCRLKLRVPAWAVRSYSSGLSSWGISPNPHL